jgi:hypothetical protein
MSTGYAGREERLHAAEVFRGKWVWLVLLGRRSKAMMIATVSALPLIIAGAGVHRPTGTP